ncbi:MAG TPA: hypothetical protein VML55_20900 [Planctomycetaceae bacterium]|nr:hypothetical protein [Planctomycetaceae bacterium]
MSRGPSGLQSARRRDGRHRVVDLRMDDLRVSGSRPGRLLPVSRMVPAGIDRTFVPRRHGAGHA